MDIAVQVVRLATAGFLHSPDIQGLALRLASLALVVTVVHLDIAALVVTQVHQVSAAILGSHRSLATADSVAHLASLVSVVHLVIVA